MREGDSLVEHLDAFNRIILDLENMGVKVEDEDEATILLSSLPEVYESFVDTLMYGRNTLTMEDVKHL